MTWTRITDQDEAAELLPAWLGRRLIGLRGRFGLLLTTGDVLRITSIGAAYLSSDGLILLDVSLDHAGVPPGVDLAWRPKHYLGAPVPDGVDATVNLAHVVAAVEFVDVATVEPSGDADVPTADEAVSGMSRAAAELDELQATIASPHRSDRVSGGSTLDIVEAESAPFVVMADMPRSAEAVSKGKKSKKQKKR
jgi:hypothetical protein